MGEGHPSGDFASHELPPVHPRSTALDGATPWLDSLQVRLLPLHRAAILLAVARKSTYGVNNKTSGRGEGQARERVSAILLSCARPRPPSAFSIWSPGRRRSFGLAKARKRHIEQTEGLRSKSLIALRQGQCAMSFRAAARAGRQ